MIGRLTPGRTVLVLAIALLLPIQNTCVSSKRARSEREIEPEDVARLAAAALRDCVVAAYGEWPGPVLGWMMQAGASSAGSPHLPMYWRWQLPIAEEVLA